MAQPLEKIGPQTYGIKQGVFEVKQFTGVMDILAYINPVAVVTECVKFEDRIFIHFELLAFNAQKFTGSRDPGYAPFSLCEHVHQI